VVKLALLGAQAGFDIPQTFAVGKLCKCHAEVLIEAGEAFDLVVAAIPLDAAPKRMHRQVIGHLRKNEFACVH